jgi:hypothetical protein
MGRFARLFVSPVLVPLLLNGGVLAIVHEWSTTGREAREFQDILNQVQRLEIGREMQNP